MSLFGISMVRNEADVLETWTRYHLQLLDGLIVADHRSIDETPQILTELVEEGLPIEVRRVDETGYGQVAAVTQLARRAVSLGADWVFPLDADEFLNVRRTAPSQILGNVGSNEPFALPWETYVPTVEDPTEVSNPLLRITWRLRKESQPFEKVAIPANLIRDQSVSVGRGSHLVLRDEVAISPGPAPNRWCIAHLPVRSVEQITRKVLVGWISTLANPERGPRTNYHWQKWFHYLIEQDLAELDLGHLAITYLDEKVSTPSAVELVQDPLPGELTGFELRYTADARISPMKALALAAESQAADLALLRGKLE